MPVNCCDSIIIGFVLPFIGGSESGNSSSDTNTSGSISTSLATQVGDQTGRASNAIVSTSLSSTSHTVSGLNPTTEACNNARNSTVVSTSTAGQGSVRDPMTTAGSDMVTMSTSSAATVMSSTSLSTSEGDMVQSSKPASSNSTSTGTISASITSGTSGTATTSSLPSCGGSTTAPTSSSYADYRQIKRKLRSQVDDAVTPSVGSNGQQGKIIP